MVGWLSNSQKIPASSNFLQNNTYGLNFHSWEFGGALHKPFESWIVSEDAILDIDIIQGYFFSLR